MNTTVVHHACTIDKCISTRRFAIMLPMAEVLHFCEDCVTRHVDLMHLLTSLDSKNRFDLHKEYMGFKGGKCYYCSNSFLCTPSISISKIFKFKAGKIGCIKCIKFDPQWNCKKIKLYYDVFSKLLCKVNTSKLKAAKNNQVLLFLLLLYIYVKPLSYICQY